MCCETDVGDRNRKSKAFVANMQCVRGEGMKGMKSMMKL